MGFKKNNPGCGCCEVDCQVFVDDFNRTNSASLGSDWTETDWSIVSNRASTSTSDAIAITTAQASAASFNVAAKMTVSAAGDAVRLIAAYKDADNYLFAEFVPAGTSGVCATIKFYKRVAGVETQVGDTEQFVSFATSTQYTFIFCVTGSELQAHIVHTTRVVSHRSDALAGTFSGRKAGFATGTITGTVTVDDFALAHAEDQGCPTCERDIPCQMHYDQFTRSDSTDLGCDYDEVAGDWAIVSTQLRATSSNGVLALTTRPDDEQTVEVAFKVANAGDQARAIVRYLDEDNYLFAEVEVGASSSTLRLYSRAGGVNTLLKSIATSGITTSTTMPAMRVCYHGNTLTAGVATTVFGLFAPLTRLSAVVSATGLLCGLGTGTIAASVNFDEFKLISRSAGCDTCLPQCTNCDLDAQPLEEVVVDIGAATLGDAACDGCSEIGGEYVLAMNNASACTLTYGEIDYCDFSDTDPVTGTAGTQHGFNIVAQVVSASGLNVRWRVTVEMFLVGTTHNRTAIYQSEEFPKSECQVLPRTLTKTGDNFDATQSPGGNVWVQYCTGEMPATITLEAA